MSTFMDNFLKNSNVCSILESTIIPKIKFGKPLMSFSSNSVSITYTHRYVYDTDDKKWK